MSFVHVSFVIRFLSFHLTIFFFFFVRPTQNLSLADRGQRRKKKDGVIRTRCARWSLFPSENVSTYSNPGMRALGTKKKPPAGCQLVLHHQLSLILFTFAPTEALGEPFLLRGQRTM